MVLGIGVHRDAILRSADNNAWQPFASTGAYVAVVGITGISNNNYTSAHGSIPFIMGYDDDDDDDYLYTRKSEYAIRVRFVRGWCYYSSCTHFELGDKSVTRNRAFTKINQFKLLSFLIF